MQVLNLKNGKIKFIFNNLVSAKTQKNIQKYKRILRLFMIKNKRFLFVLLS